MNAIQKMLESRNGESIKKGLKPKIMEFFAKFMFLNRKESDYVKPKYSDVFQMLFLLVPQSYRFDNILFDRILSWYSNDHHLLAVKNRTIFYEWLAGIIEFDMIDIRRVQPYYAIFLQDLSVKNAQPFVVKILKSLTTERHVAIATKVVEEFIADSLSLTIFVTDFICFLKNFRIVKFIRYHYYINSINGEELTFYKNKSFVEYLLECAEKKGFTIVETMNFNVDLFLRSHIEELVHDETISLLLSNNKQKEKEILFQKICTILNHLQRTNLDEFTALVTYKAVYEIECKLNSGIHQLDSILIGGILPKWDYEYCYTAILGLFEWIQIARFYNFEEFKKNLLLPLHNKLVFSIIDRNLNDDKPKSTIPFCAEDFVKIGDFIFAINRMITNYIEPTNDKYHRTDRFKVRFLKDTFDFLHKKIFLELISISRFSLNVLWKLIRFYGELLPKQEIFRKNLESQTGANSPIQLSNYQFIGIIPDYFVQVVFFSNVHKLIEAVVTLMTRFSDNFSSRLIKLFEISEKDGDSRMTEDSNCDLESDSNADSNLNRINKHMLDIFKKIKSK